MNCSVKFFEPMVRVGLASAPSMGWISLPAGSPPLLEPPPPPEDGDSSSPSQAAKASPRQSTARRARMGFERFTSTACSFSMTGRGTGARAVPLVDLDAARRDRPLEGGEQAVGGE